MFKRILLFSVVIGSLVWIAFFALETMSEKNNYQPEDLFGFEDKAVLIVHRPYELSIDILADFQSPCEDLFNDLNDSLFSRAYVSGSRSHFLLKREGIWTEKLINDLFLTQQPDNFQDDQFKVGEYSGRFYKTGLYVWKGEIAKIEESTTFVADKKASGTIIEFDQSGTISSYTDIYVKEDGFVNYVTKNEAIESGKKVSDEELFAGLISRNIDSYHFYERDYYASKDSSFKSSPMFAWMLNGFVELEYNGEQVMVSDYIQGQDPILILNELNGSYDTTWFQNKLTSNFPVNGNKYTVQYLDDYVVMSTNKDLCDKMVSDYKLGNTIALNEKARSRYYGSLPKLVSERTVSEIEVSSKSVYKGKIMASYAYQHQAESIIEKKTVSISAGGEIHDFHTFKGDGNVISLTKDGKLSRFVKESKEWTKQISGDMISDIQVIDLHARGEKQILVNSKDEIHLYNLDGSSATGFPIKLDATAVNQVKFYRWKGKSYFLIATDDNKINHFDAKGRELNQIKIDLRPTRMIDVWASQKRLFAGFTDGARFIMYDMDKRRVHREFALPGGAFPLKVPNELLHFGANQNVLVKSDQKGNQMKIGEYPNIKILNIDSESTPTIAIQSNNEIHLLNMEGMPFVQIRLPFNEVADIFVENTDSGKTYIGIIDGLENNVYLYGTDGERVISKVLEGEAKLDVQSTLQGHRITTIVDQFIVQYFEN